MDEFKRLCQEGYLAVRSQSEKLLTLLEISKAGAGTGLPCLEGDACEQVKHRLRLDQNAAAAAKHMVGQINNAEKNVRTEILECFHNWTHSGI